MSDMCLNLENESGYAYVGACENADGCNRIKEMDDLRKDSITDAVSIYGYVMQKEEAHTETVRASFQFCRFTGGCFEGHLLCFGSTLVNSREAFSSFI